MSSYRFLTRLVGLLAAALVAAPLGTAYAAPKAKLTPAAIAERNAAELQKFLAALQQASSAEFVASSFHGPAKESRITETVPAEELAQLKKALASLQPLPPRDELRGFIDLLWLAELRLMDAQGKRIYALGLSPYPWVKESKIDKGKWYHRWSLPDADYDTFRSMLSYGKLTERAAENHRTAPRGSISK